MSSVKIEGNASGTGIFTIASPNSNTNRTLTLPDNTGTILTSATTTGFPAGSVIQVVSTTSSTVVTNTGIVSSLLSTSITPSSTSNKILILTSLTCVMNANANALGGSLIYRGTTSGTLLQALYSGNNSTPGCYGAFSHSFLDSPSTTSSQTYTLGINRGSSGTTSQVTEGTYSLILMEIAA